MRKTNICVLVLLIIPVLGLFMPQMLMSAVHAYQDSASTPASKSSRANYDIRDDAAAQLQQSLTVQSSSAGWKAKRASLSQSMRTARESLSRRIPGLTVREGRSGSLK